MEPPETIVCVDCGGTCHFLGVTDATDVLDDGAEWFGSIATYRCQDCLDRWDVELPDEDDGSDEAHV